MLMAQELLKTIEIQLMKTHNGIFFLKAGVLDPYFIEPLEILNAQNNTKLNYITDVADIDYIVGRNSFSVVADPEKSEIYIIIQLPVAAQMKYRVYENLVFPKIDDSNIDSISGIPKYFAISSNGTQYFENDTLNCIILHRQYICKNVIVRSLSHYPSCVSSIYANKSDMLCQYKKYGNAFELHHIVNTGLLLFSTTGIQVNIICVKDDKISLNQTRARRKYN